MTYELVIESYQLYIILKHKASNWGKRRPDLPKLIIFLQVYENVRISVQAIFDSQKITLAVSSL